MSFFSNLFNSNKNKNPYKLALEGEVLKRKGKFKQALNIFNAAIKIEPDNDMFYASRSDIKKSIKDYDGALKDIEKAISIQPKVDAYKTLLDEINRLK